MKLTTENTPATKLKNVSVTAARLTIAAVLVVAGQPAMATWLPTNGANAWTNPANWSNGVIDGVLLPSTYTGTTQTNLTPATNLFLDFGISTAHTNQISLTLRPTNGSTTLSLTGDSSIKFLSPSGSGNTRFIIGGANATPLNIALQKDLLVEVGSVLNANNTLVLIVRGINRAGDRRVADGASATTREARVIPGTTGGLAGGGRKPILHSS